MSAVVTRSVRFSAWLALAGLGLGLGSGCMHPGRTDPARVGPLYTPTNFVGEPSLGGIRRVVVLPVWGDRELAPETAAELDPVINAALQKVQRFEVVALARESARRQFRAEAFSSASALPHELLARLKREFAADAVLFVDVTVFRPYRPLAIGLRAKLAAIDGSRLIWTFDNVFSADDATVANAARSFYIDADSRAPTDLTHGVLQAPTRFAAYASAAMFATLPPVNPPPVKPVAQTR